MYELGALVFDRTSWRARSGKVVAISRSDSACIVEYDDTGVPQTSGWCPMSQFDPMPEMQ